MAVPVFSIFQPSSPTVPVVSTVRGRHRCQHPRYRCQHLTDAIQDAFSTFGCVSHPLEREPIPGLGRGRQKSYLIGAATDNVAPFTRDMISKERQNYKNRANRCMQERYIKNSKTFGSALRSASTKNDEDSECRKGKD
mmetsp:Transcript_34997/g.75819  ORF Transcript_34997/g.75819 Transcript_34997/m.75819 type:complete len:138 (+) Transcript_34997:347-760(+)